MGAGNGAPNPCGGQRSRLVTMPETEDAAFARLSGKCKAL